MSRVPSVLSALLAGRQPDPTDATAFMHTVMAGEADEAHLTAVLTALQLVPPTAPTLAAFARAIRAHMVPVPTQGPLLDTCGTGGSGLSTANTSTMAAFVVAACGVRVAKHGNRSSSGRCGSSDLLDALGVPLRLSPEDSAQLIDQTGIAFLFAPAYHPAFRHVGPLRKRLGFRTVFNLLGPLCNPAGADHQLLGVSDPRLAGVLASALRLLGSERVMVVHGTDGLDELSTTAPSRVWQVGTAGVSEDRVDPQALGLRPSTPDQIRGGDVTQNVLVFQDVFSGSPSPHADLVALNAGAALQVAGRVDTLAAGVKLARTTLQSGAARAAFVQYRHAAQGMA